MQQKYGKDGFVTITVALDDLAEFPNAKSNALVSLTKAKVTTPNVFLDEPQAFWQEKLRVESLPTVYVFDRRGKWTFFDGQALAKDEHGPEKLVTQLLKEAP